MTARSRGSARPGAVLVLTGEVSVDDFPAQPTSVRSALPKAHLHLHFTGSMRHGTLLELAERDGIQPARRR